MSELKKKITFLLRAFHSQLEKKNIKMILNFELNISKNKSKVPFFSVSD